MLLIWEPNNPKKKPFPVQSISSLEGLKRKHPGKFAQYSAGGSIQPAEVKEIKKKDAVVVEKIEVEEKVEATPQLEEKPKAKPKAKPKKKTAKTQSKK